MAQNASSFRLGGFGLRPRRLGARRIKGRSSFGPAQTIGRSLRHRLSYQASQSSGRAAASGAPQEQQVETTAKGSLEVYQEEFAPGHREGQNRIGQDAQGFWPLVGQPRQRTQRDTPEVGVLTWSSAPTAHWEEPESDASGGFISEGKEGPQRTPASSSLVSLQLRNQGLGSLKLGNPNYVSPPKHKNQRHFAWDVNAASIK